MSLCFKHNKQLHKNNMLTTSNNNLLIELSNHELPGDCLGKIIEYLTTKDWISFSYVNKSINALKYDQVIMYNKCRTVKGNICTKQLHEGLRAAQNTLFNVDLKGSLLASDEMFTYFQGTIQTLNMSGCWRTTITDNAFSYLKGTIRSLNMSNCNQSTISDKAFSFLEGTIQTLDICGCNQTSITNKAFSYLKGVKALKMSRCNQSTITPKVFSYIRHSVHTLDIDESNLETTTDEVLTHLPSTIQVLAMSCSLLADKSKALMYLRALPLKKLYLKGRQEFHNSKYEVEQLLESRIFYI